MSQEGDDYEVIPNSKFFVSRTGNKDNSSAYNIDGKKATFKDVGILLRSHGIDLDHNRFLILQVINYILVYSLHVCYTCEPPLFCQTCPLGFRCPSGKPFSPNKRRVANSKPWCCSVTLVSRGHTPLVLGLL